MAGYSITISAVDNFTKVINNINTKLGALAKKFPAFKSPLGALQAGFQKFAGGSFFNNIGSNLGKMGGGLKNIAGFALKAFRSFSQFLGPLGIVAGAATLAGIEKLAAAWAKLGNENRKAAAYLGIPASAVQNLHDAEKLAGVKPGAFTESLQTVQDTIRGVQNDRQGHIDQVRQLDAMDIKTDGRSVEDVQADLFNKMQTMMKNGTPIATIREVARLMGVSEEMFAPIKEHGKDAVKFYQDEAAKLAPRTEQQIKAANDLREAIDSLDLALDGLTSRILAKYTPILTDLLKSASKWISQDSIYDMAQALGMDPTINKEGQASGYENKVTKVHHDASEITELYEKKYGKKRVSDLTPAEIAAPTSDTASSATPSTAAGATPATPSAPGASNATDGTPMSLATDISGYKPMLDLIGKSEGTDKGRGYNETLGYGKFTNGNQDLTNMTLDELDALQTKMLKDPKNTYNSSAAGRYQIVQATMHKLREQLHLTGDMKYTKQLQDLLGATLIQNDRDAGGSVADIQRRLSHTWTSLPSDSSGIAGDGKDSRVSNDAMHDALRALPTLPVPPIPPPVPPVDVSTIKPQAFNVNPSQQLASANGTVTINLNHKNAPPGTYMTASSTGRLIQPVNYATSMPLPINV